MTVIFPEDDGNDDIELSQEELDTFNSMCKVGKLDKAFHPVISETQEYQMTCYSNLIKDLTKLSNVLCQKVEAWHRSKNSQSWEYKSNLEDMVYSNTKFEIVSSGHFLVADYNLLIDSFNEFYVELFKELDSEAGINFLFGTGGKTVNADESSVEYHLPKHYIKDLLSKDTITSFADNSDNAIVIFKALDSLIQGILESLQALTSLGYGIDDLAYDLD